MAVKLAFISDIHSNSAALKAVLEELDVLGISRDHTYAVGDLVGYGPRPNEVLDILVRENIISILGNYDEAVGFYLPTCGCKADTEKEKKRTENSLGWSAKRVSEEQKGYLRSLEENLELNIEGVCIYITHGSPFSINEYVYEVDGEKHLDIVGEVEADIIVMGHTHIPYIKKLGQTLLVNPGSVGRPKDGDPRAAFCVIDIDAKREETVKAKILRVKYDVQIVAAEIRKSELLDEFANHLETGIVD